MTDFGTWFARQGAEQPSVADDVERYEALGFWLRADEWMAECRFCKMDTPIYCHPSELKDDYKHACFGSPRCIP